MQLETLCSLSCALRSIVAAVVFLNSAAAHGLGPAADAHTAGVTCFEQLDFDCAIELLSVAAQQTPLTDIARRVEIHRKLAESYLALGQPSDAVSEFEQLLIASPEYRIDAGGTSPKILDALAEARKIQAARTATRVAVEPIERAVQMALAVGAEILTGGEDRRNLKTGPLIEIQATLRLADPWRLGAGMLYISHALVRRESTERVFAGWAGLGLGGTVGPLDLAASGGLGAAYFGVIGEEERTGLLLPLRLCADLRVGSVLRLGILLAPGWLLTFGDSIRSSFTISLAGRVAATF